MKVFSYEKTANGPVLVGQREISTQPPVTAIDRYRSFFEGVPLHGGHEWETLTALEIAEIFRKAIKETVDLEQLAHDRAVAEHNTKSKLARWWNVKVKGWTAPKVSSAETLREAVIARCRGLANWMESMQYRPFYRDSDVKIFINKPREVAGLLQAQVALV